MEATTDTGIIAELVAILDEYDRGEATLLSLVEADHVSLGAYIALQAQMMGRLGRLTSMAGWEASPSTTRQAVREVIVAAIQEEEFA